MLWAAIVATVLTVNSGINFIYASDMVFDELKPEGHSGPLGDAASELVEDDPNLMITRRLYAIEAWLTSWPAGVGAAVTPFLWYYTIMAWPW
jgi:hypothetical protein